jgi:hypothetical protein
MSGLPFRDWRWQWLSLALGVAAFAVMAIPLLVLYLPALGIVAGFDWLGDRIQAAHIHLVNRDIARKHGYARKPGEARPEGWLP